MKLFQLGFNAFFALVVLRELIYWIKRRPPPQSGNGGYSDHHVVCVHAVCVRVCVLAVP